MLTDETPRGPLLTMTNYELQCAREDRHSCVKASMRELDAQRAQVAALTAERDALRERVQAWEEAIDGFMVSNWIGVYDRALGPREALNRAIEHALDQERVALRDQLATLTTQQTAFEQWVTEQIAFYAAQQDAEHTWRHAKVSAFRVVLSNLTAQRGTP